jgi:hypothetical protein
MQEPRCSGADGSRSTPGLVENAGRDGIILLVGGEGECPVCQTRGLWSPLLSSDADCMPIHTHPSPSPSPAASAVLLENLSILALAAPTPSHRTLSWRWIMHASMVLDRDRIQSAGRRAGVQC